MSHDNNGNGKSTDPTTGHLQIPVGALIPQPHGGALRNGGTNRGGRPPDAWKAALARLTSRPAAYRAARRITRDPDHPAWLGTMKWATQIAYPELAAPAVIQAVQELRVTLRIERPPEGRPVDPVSQAIESTYVVALPVVASDDS